MKQWTENYLTSIAQIEAQDEKLRPYERGFVSFLRRQVEKEIAVSRTQAVDLDEIWKRVVA